MRWLLTTLFAVCLACNDPEPTGLGEAESSSPSPGTSGEGGAHGGHLATNCEVICNAGKQTGCSAAQNDCVSNCQAQVQSVPACGDEALALNDCQAKAPVSCDNNGNPTFAGCDALADKLSLCIDKMLKDQSSGAGGTPQTPGEFPTVCNLLITTECVKCVAYQCCAESDAVLSDPAATALIGCLGSCTSFEFCRNKCYQDIPQGKEKVDALIACKHAACPPCHPTSQ